MKYELCYLVGETKEQDLPRIKEEVADIISKEGGKWLEPQIEEKRKMAYKVGKEIRGFYISQQFEIIKEDTEDGEVKNPIESMNQKMNLYHDVLRFIFINADELPELKVREGKPAFAKSSGNERRDYKKSSYGKKPEPIAIKKEKLAPIAEAMPVEKKEEDSAVPAKEEKLVSRESKKDGGKSIDEKIDEILNI